MEEQPTILEEEVQEIEICVDSETEIVLDNDYNNIQNKPSINSVELVGNKTSADLGLASSQGLADLSDHVDVVADEIASNLEEEIDNRTNAISAEETARIAEDQRLAGLINTETAARINADNGLQEQIDGITASSDVKDIVGTKEELDAYDKTTLGNNDIIKVISDSTHEDAMSYYRYDSATNAFVYIGKEGPFYTKAESDVEFAKATDLSSYVKKTDYATGATGGVIKTGNGIGMAGSGIPYATIYGASDYERLSGTTFLGKGTVENMLTARKYLMPEYTQTLPAQGSDNKLYLVPASEQPDVLKSAEGKEVTLTDASQGDLEWGAIKGETSQTSTSGKNLFYVLSTPTSHTSNIELVSSDTNSVVVRATGASGTYNSYKYEYTLGQLGLVAGQTYTMSCKLTTDNPNACIRVAKDASSGGSDIITRLTPTNNPATFTIPADSTKIGFFYYIDHGHDPTVGQVSKFENIQLEKGSSKTDFEPYTAGASPNPTYPQEVKTVTGKNKVTVRGKNLLNEEYLRTATYTTNVYKATDAGFDLPNDYYRFKAELKPNKTPIDGLFVALTKVPNPNSTSTRLFAIRNGASVEPAETLVFDGQMYFSFYPTSINVDDIFDRYNFMLEPRATISDYEPYHEQSVEVNLGKNLLYNRMLTAPTTKNGVTATPNPDGTISFSGTCTALSWFQLNQANFTVPAGTYTYSGATGGVQLYNDKFGIVDSATTKTLTEQSSGDWSIRVPSGVNTNGIVLKPQLEVGSVATEYAPYFTPIELCKIGTHQDRIYKDSEGWKLHKEVGKLTINGIETYLKGSWQNAETPNFFQVAIAKADLAELPDVTTSQALALKCNYFTTTSTSVWTLTENSVAINPSENYMLQYKIDKTIAYDIITFKNWLSTHPVTTYYALATPTDTLITNSALIEQLDQLSTLATAKGYNLVFTATEHEQPTLAFEYYRPDPTVTKDEYIWVENHYEQLGGHKKFAHNLTVNAHTALGHWQYSFQITTDTHEHFTQLSQVAKYIADHHAGLTLPISGTYTEGNDIYFITKLEGYSSTQVAIEMRKLSDGSLRRITTGAVDVMDYIS